MFTGLLDPFEADVPARRDRPAHAGRPPDGRADDDVRRCSSRLELGSSRNTVIAVQRETLDNLTEGVAAFGGDGRLKLSNPAFGNLWGLNPEFIGEPHITRLVEKMKGRIPPHRIGMKRENLVSQCLTRQRQEGHPVPR